MKKIVEKALDILSNKFGFSDYWDDLNKSLEELKFTYSKYRFTADFITRLPKILKYFGAVLKYYNRWEDFIRVWDQESDSALIEYALKKDRLSLTDYKIGDKVGIYDYFKKIDESVVVKVDKYFVILENEDQYYVENNNIFLEMYDIVQYLKKEK